MFSSIKVRNVLILAPSSYLIQPYGNTDAKPMDPSVKKWVKWMRIIQLVLRCLELLCACGLLAMMILIRGVDTSTGWIMRIVVGYLKVSMREKFTY
jgi:hypothetical protein